MNIRLSQKVQTFAMLRMVGGAPEESILWTQFHHLQPPAGAIPTLTFFQNPVGQSDQFGATVTQEDSNMTAAGQFSAPNRMLVNRISVAVQPATTQTTPITAAATPSINDDIYQVTKRGFFEFTILVKPYLQLAPLGLLPAGYGLSGAFSAATTVAATSITNSVVNNGQNLSDQGYKTMLPLETQVAFQAQISFPKTTLTTLNALRIGVLLHGALFRPQQ